MDSRLGRACARADPGRLRKEQCAGPAIALTVVALAFVQPIRIARPELDGAWDNPEPRPERWPRNLGAVEAAAGVGDAPLEARAVVQRVALPGGPRTELILARSRREVRVRFFGRDTFDRAFDPHLLFDRRPIEAQRRVRVDGKRPGLPALEIGVEDEAAPVEGLQQDVAARRTPIGIDGGEYHRIGLDTALASLLEQIAKHVDGIDHPALVLSSGIPIVP